METEARDRNNVYLKYGTLWELRNNSSEGGDART